MKLQQNITEENTIYIDLLKTDINKAFRKLYTTSFPHVRNYIIGRGKNEQDAEDIFQEALIILYNKVQEDKLTLTTSIQGYIFGICRMLMMSNKYNKYSREVYMLDKVNPIQDGDLVESMTEESQYQLFQEKLQALPLDQQNVLKLFLDGSSSKQIANIMGYRSEKYARKKKMISKNKLVALIQAAPTYRELIAA